MSIPEWGEILCCNDCFSDECRYVWACFWNNINSRRLQEALLLWLDEEMTCLAFSLGLRWIMSPRRWSGFAWHVKLPPLWCAFPPRSLSPIKLNINCLGRKDCLAGWNKDSWATPSTTTDRSPLFGCHCRCGLIVMCQMRCVWTSWATGCAHVLVKPRLIIPDLYIQILKWLYFTFH